MPNRSTETSIRLEIAQDEYIKQINPEIIRENPNADPHFLYDNIQNFAPSLCMVFTYVTYFYTGNMVLAGWLVYVGTPIYNLFINSDGMNIQKKYERRFAESSMFLIPLYACQFFGTLQWLYCMAIFSTKW